MYDVNFKTAVIALSNLIVGSYAAQDLETQIIGPVVPWTYDAQNGDTFLGLDFIPPTSINDFDYQDLEGLTVGAIALIPSQPVLTSLSVFLNVGVFTQVLNFGDDDLESYPIGNITQLTQSFSGTGDITMNVGFIRAFA